MTDLAVELRTVTKRFPNPGGGEVHAVDNVTLGIENGEFFSLLGPSGCGKTTTLRMIAGFERPTLGDIYIKGQRVTTLPPYQRPVNTVFQNYALFQHMTIAQNVAFGLEMEHLSRPEIQQRVGAALEMVQLGGLGNRKPRQLSGGQQQRVALARALIKRPAVLLLDEPLGALDQKLRKDMQIELKSLQGQVGITFIYVTHDQEEALTMSDRIAVMNRGKILQVGRPVEIYERPRSRFVADFIGETNFMAGIVSSLNGKTATVSLKNIDGRLIGLRQDELAAGQPVTISIRPEKMHLSELRSEKENSFLGRVVNTAYIGSDTRVVVDLGRDQHLTVWEQNKMSTLDERHFFSPGQEVWVSFVPENTLILADEMQTSISIAKPAHTARQESHTSTSQPSSWL